MPDPDADLTHAEAVKWAQWLHDTYTKRGIHICATTRRHHVLVPEQIAGTTVSYAVCRIIDVVRCHELDTGDHDAD